jgi:hypothetical protein
MSINARERQSQEGFEMCVLAAGFIALLPPYFVSMVKVLDLSYDKGDDLFCDVVRQVVVVAAAAAAAAAGNLTTSETTTETTEIETTEIETPTTATIQAATTTSIGFGCFGADKRIPYDHDQIDVLDHSGGFTTAEWLANTAIILGIFVFLFLFFIPIAMQARPLRPLCLAIPVAFMLLSFMTLCINPLLLQSSFCHEFVELRYKVGAEAGYGMDHYNQNSVAFVAAGVTVHDSNNDTAALVTVHCELGPRAANTDIAALCYLLVASISTVVILAIFRKQDSYRAVRTTEAPPECHDEDDGDAKGLELEETHLGSTKSYDG